MPDGVRVVVLTLDPVSKAGLSSFLAAHPGIAMVDRSSDADVVLLCVEPFTVDALAAVRRPAAAPGPPIVLVVPEIAADDLNRAVRWGVVRVIPHSAVTAERVTHGVLTAATSARVAAPDLARALLKEVQQLRKPANTASGGLTTREVEVLRMLADGLDTSEIARALSYADRTVKKVIVGIQRKLNLHNRTQAVAYALRTGVI